LEIGADFSRLEFSSQFDVFPFRGSIQRSIPAFLFVMFLLLTVSELVSVMQADSDAIASSIGVARLRL